MTLANDKVKCLYGRHDKNATCPTLDELLDVLRSETARFSKAFIVVDALDDCSEIDGTRGMLTALRALTSSANLLITSRDLAPIAASFHETKRLNIHASDDDVCSYIERRISDVARLVIHVREHSTLQEEIVKKILENVRGMFLLARLHMDSLAIATSRLHVRKILEHLPKEVNLVYNETMKRVDGQADSDKELALKIFCWIIHAYRQLFLEGLQYALAVSSDMTKMDSDALVDEAMLTSVCAGWVVVDKDSNVIRLVHHTAQEYFDRRQDRFPLAQVNIASTCLTYLSLDVFRVDERLEHWEIRPFLQSNPLLDYTARYWGRHACGHVKENILETIVKYLEDPKVFYCSVRPCPTGHHIFLQCTYLHFLAWSGQSGVSCGMVQGQI